MHINITDIDIWQELCHPTELSVKLEICYKGKDLGLNLYTLFRQQYRAYILPESYLLWEAWAL